MQWQPAAAGAREVVSSARLCKGFPDTSPFCGSVAAVMHLDRMPEGSSDHRVFDAMTMRSDTEGVSEVVGKNKSKIVTINFDARRTTPNPRCSPLNPTQDI